MTYVPHSDKYKAKQPADVEYLVEQEKRRREPIQLINKRMIKERMPHGLLGYTYLGHGEFYLNRNLDVDPDKKDMVEKHETNHTDREYETRVRTEEKLVDANSIENKVISLKQERERQYRNAA